MKTVLILFFTFIVGFYAGNLLTKQQIKVSDEINNSQLLAKVKVLDILKDSLFFCKKNYEAVSSLYFENYSIQ